MKVLKRILVLIGIGIIFLGGSCSIKPRGWWSESVIGVMADSTDWEIIQGDLRRAYEKVIRTPQIENTYNLKYITTQDFDRYTEFRYLILLSTLESQGKVGKIVNRVVEDPEIRAGVESGEYYVFTQRNQWAKDQLMTILIGKDIPALREKLETNQEFLYNIFETDFKERLKDELLERRFHKEIEKELMISYGWSLKVHKGYFLAQEFPKNGFLWFRRMYPERWVFVRWIDGGNEELLNAQWIVGERNRIGAQYYDGDEVVNQYLYSYRSSFLGRTAQVTTGLWENDAKIKGGPFKNYTFYDPLSRRVYMIDLAVHAPEKDKIPYLRRMDTMAETFITIFDKESG